MKETIETKTVKIGERDVEFYLWLTQDEEDQLLEIITGGKEVEVGGGEMKFTASAKMMADQRKAKVQAYCKNLSWEEFSVLSPKLRVQVEKVINDIEEESKKK